METEQLNQMLTIPAIPKLNLDWLYRVEISIQGNKLIKQGKELLKNPVKNETESIAVQGVAKLINHLYKEIEKSRAICKAPTIEAGKAVDNHFKPILAELGEVVNGLKDLIINFEHLKRLKHEEELEAARKEEERRTKISIAKGGTGETITPVERPIDPKLTSTASTVERFVVEIVDVHKLSPDFLEDNRVKETLRKVVQETLDDKIRILRTKKRQITLDDIGLIPGVLIKSVMGVRT